MDEILWCDHSNEISFAVLLHGSICFLNYIFENGIFLESSFFWSSRVKTNNNLLFDLEQETLYIDILSFPSSDQVLM